MTVDEIKQLVASGQTKSNSTPIDTGSLSLATGGQQAYEIFQGWDIASSYDCDEKWGRSNLELFEYIEQQQYDEDTLKRVLCSIQTEDHHWNWFNKSLGTTSEEYEWFYLYAEGEPQAACLIFHPKDSALEKYNIFYVEFLAVAPWNRSCLVRERKYIGAGSTLLRAALRYSLTTLHLSPGFSLHSLPQASGYYSKLKMVNVASRDKGPLLYFELPKFEAKKLLGAA